MHRDALAGEIQYRGWLRCVCVWGGCSVSVIKKGLLRKWNLSEDLSDGKELGKSIQVKERACAMALRWESHRQIWGRKDQWSGGWWAKRGMEGEEGEWWPEASPPGTWKPSPGVGIKISRRAMIWFMLFKGRRCCRMETKPAEGQEWKSGNQLVKKNIQIRSHSS